MLHIQEYQKGLEICAIHLEVFCLKAKLSQIKVL